jgi:2,5-furandicarboxylate decarboxylase 1
MKNNSTDLRGFLLMLQSENELVRVKRDVNAEYEIAAVTARVDGKQAVLFEKVRGSKSRVVCNVIATPRRFYLALGGTSHKAHEADVKKNIHARVTEALHSLSEPTRAHDGALFEETHIEAYTNFP